MDSDSDLFPVSADEVDSALEALWHGRSRDFERLLEGEAGDAPALAGLFGETVARGLPEVAAEPIPNVANFTILRELGRGGMGVVYEARQQLPPRTVALKVIRRGAASSTAQVRLFEREIRSLARLEHRNIAAIHAAGVTEDGQPFFAMELVRGRTLLQFVREPPSAPTSETQRIRLVLGLFATICEAISYAHQRGVIHRDLKPSNILVADQAAGTDSRAGPEVKVLDFGLARITDTDAPPTVTMDGGQIRGTLPYMAPEQIQGDPADVDTRCDGYALGVLLFEMLTGRLPYDVIHASFAKIARLICETPPARPSLLRPTLRGDLDTIVLKAMAKDREQRYQTVAALGEDIGRFLSHQPILARPQSAFYQVSKWVARHRIASFFAAAVVLVSVFGFAVSASLYRAARRAQFAEAAERKLVETERDRAVEAEHQAEAHRRQALVEAEKALAVTEFVTEMLGSADPDRDGRDVRVVDVLDRAAEQIDATLSESLEVQAAVRHVLGSTYLNLGRPQEAEREFNRALEIRLDRLGPAHDDTQETRHNLAAALSELNRGDEAESLAREVLRCYVQEKGEDDPAVMRALNNLGLILFRRGNLDEAEEVLQKTVDRQTAALGDGHVDTLSSMSALGIVLQTKGAYDRAETLFRRVVDRRAELFPENHPRRLVAEENLASVLHDQGRLDEAEALFTTLLESCRRVMGDEHLRTLVTINNLAKVFQDQGRLDRAEPLFREDYETRVRVFGREQQGTLVAANNVAMLYKDMGRFEEAEQFMRETIDIAARILPADHWYHAVFQCNLGACLTNLGRLDEAEARLTAGLAGLLNTFGPDHSRVARVRQLLADLHAKRGNQVPPTD